MKRRKIVEYNGNDYSIAFRPDRFGVYELVIYKRNNDPFCIRLWDKIYHCYWVDFDPNENPIEFARAMIEYLEKETNEKSEYEKKLDEWFK